MRKILYFAIAIVALIIVNGCTVNKASFEQSHHVFFEQTVDNMKIGSALNAKVPKGAKIAIRSLEADATVDKPVVSVLEDQMVQSLLAAGFKVVERDDNALNHLFKESNNDKYFVPRNKFSWANGKELSVDTKSFPEGSELDFIPTNLVAADYLLCYRIQECGLTTSPSGTSSDVVNREGLVRLHVRVYDAKTGEAVFVNNITGTKTDQIDRNLEYQLARYHYTDFFPYDYPLQVGSVASYVSISKPVTRRRFYFRPTLGSVASEETSGLGLGLGIGLYAGEKNRYYAELVALPDGNNKGSYVFTGLTFAKKYKLKQVNLVPSLGLGYANAMWTETEEHYSYGHWYYEEYEYESPSLGVKPGLAVEYQFYKKHTLSAGLSYIISTGEEEANAVSVLFGYNF